MAFLSIRRVSACSFVVIFSALVCAAQRPTMTTHVPEAVSSGVAPMVGYLPADQRISLAVSLPLRNQDELERLLEDIYDRHSPNFHHYLSVKEFTERYGPTESDYAALQNYAEANGLKVVDKMANRMVLDIDGPVANIEAALHVNMKIYQQPGQARTFFSADREPSLDLNVPILHISGLDNEVLPVAKNFIAPPSVISSKATGSGPGGSFYGSDLRAAYYGSGTLNGAGQKLAIFSFRGYNSNDINTYFKNEGQTNTVPIKVISVNGASTTCGSGCSDVEQALDIEQALSMAPGLNQLLFYVGKSNVSIFNQMAADNTASSISCSYGWSKNQSSLDPIFEEMASQGQSVFVATGDNGSATAANVTWPSDDAWVTAVGGTVLTTKSAGGAWSSEIGWSQSAGMPSKNNIPIPSYQQLVGVITGSNQGSNTLRNIPDVSSESASEQYVCANGTCRNQGGGTSYAAPLWAGIAAMMNQQAASNGQPNVGFLNTALYDIGVGTSFTADFHDIKSGSNGAYTAVAYYDLVTGWGSPIGANLISGVVPKRR
ncbi:MAG TPA: S53 family peptidase [Candidatus Sulfotelmatobacter sp.]|nr:S53 family peptidase [Candidatus Sulfotelmatobacter sp.]